LPAAFADSPGAPLDDPEVTAPPTATSFPPRLLAQNTSVFALLVSPPAASLASLDPSGAFSLDGYRAAAQVSFNDLWYLGTVNGRAMLLEWNKMLGVSTRSGSKSISLAGSGPVFLSLGAPPTGTMSVATNTAASPVTTNASVNVTDRTGDSATITSSASSPPGGSVTQYAISKTNKGGAFTALTTDGSSATAASYGAIFDAGGFAFIGTGDLGDTHLDRTWTDATLTLRQEFLFDFPLAVEGSWDVTLRAGPSYEFTQRSITRTETIVLDPTVAGVTLPEFGIDSRDNLSTHSLGITGGLALSQDINEEWSLTLGATGTLDMYRSEYVGEIDLFGPSTEHVPKSRGTRDIMWGAKGRAGAQLDLWRPLGAGVVAVSFLGEYQWGQPTLAARTVSAPAIVSGGGTHTFTGSGTSLIDTVLGTASAWNAGIGLSYSVRF
jgi:hypothetical protein